MKLKKDFYTRPDVVKVARELIGKVLVTRIDNIYTSGIISETEAYNGIYDKACHAFGGRRTLRNEIMYGEGGNAYIYLCYGIHHLFNVVTNQVDIPDAVLVRAIFPLDGVEHMLRRRKRDHVDKILAGGPGTVSLSLGLHKGLSGQSLIQKEIWIEDRQIIIPPENIRITKRIGVESAGADALLPYRFVTDFKYFNYYPHIDKFRFDTR